MRNIVIKNKKKMWKIEKVNKRYKKQSMKKGKKYILKKAIDG